jgi:hypothetical protein
MNDIITGTTLHNWPLVQLGLRTELISLAICIIVGGIYGIGQGLVGTNGDWPTYEVSKSDALIIDVVLSYSSIVSAGLILYVCFLFMNLFFLIQYYNIYYYCDFCFR